jgi:hypothetical protein
MKKKFQVPGTKLQVRLSPLHRGLPLRVINTQGWKLQLRHRRDIGDEGTTRHANQERRRVRTRALDHC